MLAEHEQDKLIEFARNVIQVAFEGGNLDGFDIQDMGVKYDLLTKEIYNIEKHGVNEDFEDGDWIYMFTDIIKTR